MKKELRGKTGKKIMGRKYSKKNNHGEITSALCSRGKKLSLRRGHCFQTTVK
jgi:hypothetical protein